MGAAKRQPRQVKQFAPPRGFTMAELKTAKRDLELLNNPAHLITFNDPWYAKSLVEKWGMSTVELQRLVSRKPIGI